RPRGRRDQEQSLQQDHLLADAGAAGHRGRRQGRAEALAGKCRARPAADPGSDAGDRAQEARHAGRHLLAAPRHLPSSRYDAAEHFMSEIFVAAAWRRKVSLRHPCLLALLLLLGLGLAAPARAALFKAESFTLANGLQVVVLENHRAPVITQMIFYEAGSA